MGQFRSGNPQLNPITNIPGADSLNTNSDGPEVQTDTLAGFSFKRMWRGFTRKDTLSPGYMLAGSIMVPGAGQIYNRQYWKLPVVWGGIGAGIWSGIHFNGLYQKSGEKRYKTWRDLSYLGSGLIYWGSLLDGVINYSTPWEPPVPAKATLYSALLPGLGQAYNGDYWKIPIWVGGFAACGYFYHFNDMEYKRFKYLYTVGSDPESGYQGAISASQAEWYKDLYRKYRDYSIVATVAVYALNIIDAYVFSYMHDFDVSDNIAALKVQPALIPLEGQGLAFSGVSSPAIGVNMHITF